MLEWQLIFRETHVVMLCQMCHKNQANTRILTTVNGKAQEYMLCSSCATKNGYLPKYFDFGIENILSGFLENVNDKEIPNVKKCPQCGMTFSEFSNTGKLGCAKCYDVFKSELIPMIEKIHGKSTHVRSQNDIEQSNKSVNLKAKIENLQNKMQKAIDVQDFESAAQIRDEIKDLRKQVSDYE